MNIHFSIDDVIGSLLWLDRTSAQSIFDSYTFAFAQWLYKEYQIPTTCNCLYSDGTKNLSMVSEKYRNEFEECSDWLKFSFHGWNYEKNYAEVGYDEAFTDLTIVESEILRICGRRSLSRNIRTHFFSGSEAAMLAWKHAGIKVFFTADDNRKGKGINYNLNDEELLNLQTTHFLLKEGMLFVKTDIRLERYREEISRNIIPSSSTTVIFTHERFIGETWIKKAMSNILANKLCVTVK